MNKTEEKFRNDVEQFLYTKNINTWHEVIPNECKNWEKPGAKNVLRLTKY